MEKGSGLLVHISSLPSRHGIGTFGKEAHSFIRFLKKSNQKYYQLLYGIFIRTLYLSFFNPYV